MVCSVDRDMKSESFHDLFSNTFSIFLRSLFDFRNFSFHLSSEVMIHISSRVPQPVWRNGMFLASCSRGPGFDSGLMHIEFSFQQVVLLFTDVLGR